MLEHLAVHPRGGLCNRLRAIASAKRLCSQTSARCTIVWDWGDYRTLFDDDTEWMPYGPSMDWTRDLIIPGYHHIRHRHPQEGGTSENRRVPVTTHRHVAVTSWYVFCSADEPVLKGRHYEEPVLRWFPKPHPSILEKTKAFQHDHFPPRTVGMHIRRTDHNRAIARSPDTAYFREADRLVDAGHHIFLATDNEETLRMMQYRYGARLIFYPKNSATGQRWPRETFDMNDVIDDMMDLWLLVSCEFVIGSKYSAYSRVAILLNGSPRCRAIDQPIHKWREFVRKIWNRHSWSPRPIGSTCASKPFGLRPGALENARSLLEKADESLASALQRLLEKADEAIKAAPVSVMDKPAAAASGDRHDYLSFAPYFWPDPAKEDGLPYIRKDCEVNPESYSEKSDRLRLLEMSRVSETLALAYTLTGKEYYAEAAALQLRRWFIDPGYRINPHLGYAQVIPGYREGRSFGILDGHYLLPALDAAVLLTPSKHWSDTDQESLIAWTKEFLNWLRSSRNGKKESASKNNHGALYDVQIIHLALFIGNVNLARRTAEKAKNRRIAAHIEPNGSQPYELKRPESFQYSQYNLAALFKLATRAEHAGVDLWHYETERGAGIRKGLDFLMPYLEDPNKPWSYPGKQRLPEFASVLLQAGRVYGDNRYIKVLTKASGTLSFDFPDLIR